MLRGAVEAVRKPRTSGLELRNAGWDLVVGPGGCKIRHRKTVRTIDLWEHNGVPVLPVKVRGQADSV
eukprot:1481377-Prorocentrum_lima.AAC.1